MASKKYSVADIARITGYNRTTVTRWINKHKIKNAQMHGNAPMYDAQVLQRFKKSHSNRNEKKAKVSKTDQLMQEKDARISELQSEIELLKGQLNIKDKQIESATRLADQAQQLNMTDKDKEKIKLLKDDSDNKKHDDKTVTPVDAASMRTKKHWWQIWK